MQTKTAVGGLGKGFAGCLLGLWLESLLGGGTPPLIGLPEEGFGGVEVFVEFGDPGGAPVEVAAGFGAEQAP